MTTIIDFEAGEKDLDWLGLTDAIEAGHKLPKAEISDSLLYRGKDTLLQRQAWIDGLGIAVKSATIYPDNPAKDLPLIHGAVTLFDDATGILSALIDFHLVTKWKTAGDSLLAARKLARPDSRKILIVGAGTVGRNLQAAYKTAFPQASFTVWNRTISNAEKMASEIEGLSVATDLETAVGEADIVTSATMSTEPFLRGDWFQPGQHIDLIGAYRPDMRETDDTALRRARLFADSYATTVDHIGEYKTPIANGVISKEDVLADYYSIDKFQRTSDDEITLFKNGGGAHLDLMTSTYILNRFQAE
ncbi:ornithine cyclodeaminase [uncultured Shimia sp.]|uniref:ornithine cyclodeaminase family protein n=1 Tax=uncultured Shimia sp. TaxID=573152 RepID=UPI002608735B|nr:ornithine cyclodeaminase [uncultured Shimia sp.]